MRQIDSTDTGASERRRHRNLFVLTTAYALYMCGLSVDLTLTGLVGYKLAPIPALATIPFAAITAGAALATVPASMFMARYGRRPGFLLGASVATTGGLISVLAIWQHQFVLFCLGTACVGVYQGCAGYYRYTAADEAPADRRGRAIATVLGGGVVAALAGPVVAATTRSLLPIPYAGSYLLVACLAAASFTVLFFLRTGRPAAPAPAAAAAAAAPPADSAPRPLGRIALQPTFLTGVVGSAVGFFTMMLLMTAAPIAAVMHQHTIEDGAMIVQWHMVGMYAPSLVSGRFLQRVGPAWGLLYGTAASGLGATTAVLGTTEWHFMIALGLIGLGWNLMFVSGSTLIASSYRPSERSRTQALGEIITLSGSTLGSSAAGAVLAVVGWQAMNSDVLPALLLCAALTAYYLMRTRLQPGLRPAAATASGGSEES